MVRKSCKKPGFTLIELLVVIAIIALLTGILLPSLRTAKEYSKGVYCGTSMRNAIIGCQMYADQYRGYVPPYMNERYALWCRNLAIVMDNNEYVVGGIKQIEGYKPQNYCPSEKRRSVVTFGIHYYNITSHYYYPSEDSPFAGPAKLDRIPQSMYVIADGNGMINSPDDPEYAFTEDRDGDGVLDSAGAYYWIYNGLITRHLGKANFAFPDGSVDRRKAIDWVLNTRGLRGKPLAR